MFQCSSASGVQENTPGSQQLNVSRYARVALQLRFVWLKSNCCCCCCCCTVPPTGRIHFTAVTTDSRSTCYLIFQWCHSFDFFPFPQPEVSVASIASGRMVKSCQRRFICVVHECCVCVGCWTSWKKKKCSRGWLNKKYGSLPAGPWCSSLHWRQNKKNQISPGISIHTHCSIDFKSRLTTRGILISISISI